MKLFISYVFKQLFFVILISGILGTSSVFAEVNAYLNQQSFYQGDILTLRIETDINQKAIPDLSVLEKNFDIKESSSNSRINILNGKRSYRKTWVIELHAKTIGQFTIPEIVLGNEKTQEIEVNIEELPPEISAENSKHVFIESMVDIQNDEIYVQQQIPYTIKLYYDASMSSGEIILPTIENANIRVVGKEKKYKTVRAGNEFVIIERRYLISPEKSGKLLIPPTLVQGRLQLTGNIAMPKPKNEFEKLNDLFSNMNNRSIFSNRFDPFGAQRQNGPTRPFSVSSEASNVNVLPVPESFTGTSWLPAEEIKMQDSWSLNPPNLKVGELVTRTIIMQVKGLASSQIPDIEIPKSAGIKVYPEKAESETPNDGNTIYGIQRVDITYIPEKEGSITIPKIEVDWWDVNNKKQQTYTLPEWRLSVAADAAADVGIKPNEAVSEPQEIITAENLEEETITNDQPILMNWRWETILGIFAIIATLIFSLVYFGRRYLNSTWRLSKNQQQQVKFEGRKLKTALLIACNNNDSNLSADLLVKYAAFIFKDSKLQSLGAVATKLSYGSDIIKKLESSLYADNEQNWQGTDLYQLLNKGLRAKDIKQVNTNIGLAPLYPH